MYVCMYTYIYIYICMHLCMCVYIYIYLLHLVSMCCRFVRFISACLIFSFELRISGSKFLGNSLWIWEFPTPSSYESA